MRRLTMSGHRRRAASTPVAAKRRSYVSPFCESKYWGRAFKSSKLAPERQRRPDRRRTLVLSDTGALCDTGARRAQLGPSNPFHPAGKRAGRAIRGALA